MKIYINLVITTLLAFASHSLSQSLKDIAQQREMQWKIQRSYAESLAILKKMPIRVEREDGTTFELQRFENDFPVYYTISNINAAKTISTNKVWPTSGPGFSLTGSGITLGEWDAGAARASHQEFGGRVLSTQGSNHYHSTHVAGTMIAAGVSPNAIGMSYQGYLKSFDWNSDVSEMATQAASGLRVSNHSYGNITGWYWNLFGDNRWAWFGDITVSAVEDYKFGFYDDECQAWDQVAQNAPYYLIVKAAGNDRGEGPSSKVIHWVYVDGQWILQDSGRNKDGNNDGYDCIGSPAIAKNILTVGAVDDLPNGYTNPLSVVMSSFSSWGPVDDGRIKPDIVANGISLYSTLETSDNAYGTMSGTSMATPNVSGSVGLLLQLQQQLHGSTPLRSSTLKGLIIHTADEAGLYPGPDYKFGWGLMNTFKAAYLMRLDSIDGPDSHIRQLQLTEGDTIKFDIRCNGIDTLKATICWTDPAAVPPVPALDPPTKMLVNDVDLRIFKKPNHQQYQPWILNPASPTSAATTGDNITDNVEQIVINQTERTLYTVQITHKGFLNPSPQYVSLIISGNAAYLGPVYHAQETNFEYLMIPDSIIIDSVKIKNYGDSSLIIKPKVPIEHSGWLSVSEDSVTIGSMDSAYFHFIVDANILNTWMNYHGSISVLHNDTIQSPSEINVTVNTLGPTIQYSPTSFIIDVDTLEIGKDTLLIKNIGYTPLFFDLADTGNSLPTWLTLDKDSATINQGDSTKIILTTNEANVQQGEYSFDLKIQSNDNQTGTVFVPIYLHVGTRRLVQTSVKDFWNLISTPVQAIDNRKINLYPTAASSAWGYNGMYYIADSLWAGEGYWLKFDSAETFEMDGYTFIQDTLTLDEGWHIIGALSIGIPTSSVTSDPPDIISSMFFTYDHGYDFVDSILPGKGYWVKTSQSGKIILNGTNPPLIKRTNFNIISALNSITITDEYGNSKILYFGNSEINERELRYYELPPNPPEGSFDVRYNSNRFVELIPSTISDNHTFPISIQTLSEHITINWDIKDRTHHYKLQDLSGAQYELNSSGSIQLANQSTHTEIKLSASQKEIPKEFVLNQNYPNPFNPVTEIQFELPTSAYVALKVYNMLGEEVAILVNEEKQPGIYKVNWDASKFASGVYFYKLNANEFVTVRKLALIK